MQGVIYMPRYVDSSIYAVNNPYGYIYNVNHDYINHLYKRYREQHGLPDHFPISDLQRRCFEHQITKWIDEGKIVVKRSRGKGT